MDAAFTPSATCYHEAGHAVVAHRLGIDVDYVSVIETDDHRRVDPAGLPATGGLRPEEAASERALAEDHITVSWAGTLAENRLGAARDRQPLGVAADRQRETGRSLTSSDLEEIVELGDRVASSHRAFDALVEWLRIRASDLLDRHWDEVEAVARVLSRRLELTGVEVGDVIREHHAVRTLHLRPA
jgi:hypothetical protein